MDVENGGIAGRRSIRLWRMKAAAHTLEVASTGHVYCDMERPRISKLTGHQSL